MTLLDVFGFTAIFEGERGEGKEQGGSNRRSSFRNSSFHKCRRGANLSTSRDDYPDYESRREEVLLTAYNK